jgi:hypothetical protein
MPLGQTSGVSSIVAAGGTNAGSAAALAADGEHAVPAYVREERPLPRAARATAPRVRYRDSRRNWPRQRASQSAELGGDACRSARPWGAAQLSFMSRSWRRRRWNYAIVMPQPVRVGIDVDEILQLLGNGLPEG